MANREGASWTGTQALLGEQEGDRARVKRGIGRGKGRGHKLSLPGLSLSEGISLSCLKEMKFGTRQYWHMCVTCCCFTRDTSVCMHVGSDNIFFLFSEN